MINFQVLTLFPKMVLDGLNTSIIGRAAEKNIIRIGATDIREFSDDRRHFRVDDYPYGGGAGMVMQPAPVYRAYEHVRQGMEGNVRVLYMTPQGRRFDHEMSRELAACDNLIFLCGHYEGIDERVLEMIVTDYVSIGDYVLTGGELPAMVMIDSIARNVPGVLNNGDSAEFETFHDSLLEYPQYTRPPEFMGKQVPEVLLSGHHGKVEEWRRQQSILRTYKARPDLLEKAELTKRETEWLKEQMKGTAGTAEEAKKACNIRTVMI